MPFLKRLNRDHSWFFDLLILSGLYLFLRLWHFPTLFAFNPDQALHLFEAKQMVVNQDWRLVGPMVSSKVYGGRGFFIGPQYYYLLGVLGIITNWSPYLITLILMFLNLGVILLLVRLTRRKFGHLSAALSFFLFALNPYLTSHAQHYWNPHFLIPLSIFLILVLGRYWRKDSWIFLLLVGFIWGNGISFHYSALLWGLPIFIVLFKKNKGFLKIVKLGLIVLGGLFLGNLPWFLFELRNNFYNLKTMAFVFANLRETKFATIRFFVFPLVSFFFLLFAWSFKKILKFKTGWFFLGIITLLSLRGVDLNRAWPKGGIKGWSWVYQNQVASLITEDGCPESFNVASSASPDAKAYDLRLLLDNLGCQSLGGAEYPQSSTLFLVAPKERLPLNEEIWEVASLKPFFIKREVFLNDYVIFYELAKIEE